MDRQRYRLLVLIVAVMLASIYFFILSQSGLLERINLEKENSRIQQKIEYLKTEKLHLQNKLRGYRQGRYPDSDILESGYMRPGERIVFFHGVKNKDPQTGKEAAPDTSLYHRLPYMRIAWLAISAAVILGLVIYGGRPKSDNVTEFNS